VNRSILLFISVFLLCSVGRAQAPKETPNGFLNLPWGIGEAEAQPLIIERTGAHYDRTIKKRGMPNLIFHKGQFAGRSANAIVAEFSGDHMFRVSAYVAFGEKRDALEKMKQGLTATYGAPKTSGKLYRWEFPAKGTRAYAESIELAVSKGKEVRVTYTNDTMRSQLPKDAGESLDLDSL
jgi:hypothetical protein